MDVIPSAHDEPVQSKFDFDGDEVADSLLEVSFVSNSYPADVQIGNPYVDPFQGIDPDSLPSISGTVYDADRNPLDEFGVDFFTEIQDGYMGSYREYALVYSFVLLGNGKYEAKILPGEYQVEAWAWDHK